MTKNYKELLHQIKAFVFDIDGVMTDNIAQKPEQDGHMQMSDFRRALATLPDDQREAVMLVGAFGF